MENENNINGELEFVRFTQPALFKLIPKEYFEQLAETDNTLILENVYKYGPAAIISPLTYFYGITDEGKIVGFIWMGISIFQNRLKVYYMSIDKKYQNKGIIKKFKNICSFLCETNNLSSVYEVFSLHPKIAERVGGKESKCKIYEYDCSVKENKNDVPDKIETEKSDVQNK